MYYAIWSDLVRLDKGLIEVVSPSDTTHDSCTAVPRRLRQVIQPGGRHVKRLHATYNFVLITFSWNEL